MFAQDSVNWHEIIQEILENYLPLMSGKVIKDASREYPKYLHVDYYCLTEGVLSEAQIDKTMIRPFDHLKNRNLIEYKSIHEVLNEGMFRQYVARALFLENPDQNTSYRGEMTLTILTTRKPESLISVKEYAITQLNAWKYKSEWIKDLDIYILVQKGMRGQKAGEALALLQVLEGERERQVEYWNNLFDQNLSNVEVLKKIIHQINKELYMNLVQELKKEGKIEGVLKILSWTAPELVKKYEAELKAAKTEQELDKIEAKIHKDLQAKK